MKPDKYEVGDVYLIVKCPSGMKMSDAMASDLREIEEATITATGEVFIKIKSKSLKDEWFAREYFENNFMILDKVKEPKNSSLRGLDPYTSFNHNINNAIQSDQIRKFIDQSSK